WQGHYPRTPFSPPWFLKLCSPSSQFTAVVMSPSSQNACDYLISGKDRERIALLTRDGQSTYGELQSIASECAQRLWSRGGTKGDRVLLLADSGTFWAGAYLGILKAGLVCVPIPSKA